MQSETGFASSHQLKSYVASKSRLKLAARAVLSARMLAFLLLSPNGWMDQDGTWYRVGLSPGDFVLDGDWGASFPTPKGAQSPNFCKCPLWPNDWMD